MAQLSYDFNIKQAVQGMLADSTPNVVDSYAAEGNIDFGLALVYGTDAAKQVKIPVASAAFVGASVYDMVHEQDDAGNAYYRDTQTVSVLRRGRIYVPTTVAVAAGEAAYFIHTGGDEGKFRNDADTGNADLVPTGVFRSNTNPEGLAILEINLP